MSGTRERRTVPLLQLRRGIGSQGRERRSAHRGSGGEQAGSRAYRPGDPTRSIDWAASARLSSARGSDEFVVREEYAEASLRAVLLVDRSPSMATGGSGLPWLDKREAVRAAGRLLVASVTAERGLVGYLDTAEPDAPRWLPPGAPVSAALVRDRELAREPSAAGHDHVALGLRLLARARSSVPRGTFVFVLSDFLRPPPAALWRTAAGLGWELVPVVVQDPVWERSFPDAEGVLLPLAAPDGTPLPVCLRRGEAATVRAANEERHASLLAGLAAAGLDAVELSAAGEDAVLAAFLGWHRRRRARLGRHA